MLLIELTFRVLIITENLEILEGAVENINSQAWKIHRKVIVLKVMEMSFFFFFMDSREAESSISCHFKSQAFLLQLLETSVYCYIYLSLFIPIIGT